MFQRLDALLSSIVAPKIERQLSLKEQLTIDQSLPEKLGVASLTVVEDPELPATSPWKISRRAAPDRSSARGMETEMMIAEIRISPSVAHETTRQGSLSHPYLHQMVGVFLHVAQETRTSHTEVSLDTALPYSKPYRVLNRLVPSGTGENQFVTTVLIAPHFADHLARPEYTMNTHHFALDLRVMSGRGYVLTPSFREGILEVTSGHQEFPPYQIAEPVKRIIDLFTTTLQASNPDARRYDPGAKQLIQALIDTAVEKLRLQEALRSENVGFSDGEGYERKERLLARLQETEEALSAACEQTRRFFGEQILESLLFAIEDHRGEIGNAYQYLRDLGLVHGYRFWQHQERLTYLFASHPLSQLVASHNRDCEERRSRNKQQGEALIDAETYLLLEFRLSGTDASLPARASVKLCSPYEKVWDYNHNERLVCVNLTPKALKLLLNAKSLDDDSIRAVIEEITRDTETLFRNKKSQ